ncbi:MAG: sigma-70 family RNA polymerase sigma factor [Chloroflexi bacterium]|nr:sigma-70 family RNA polymerase sigma factor [Chloroflexota bacterium]
MPDLDRLIQRWQAHDERAAETLFEQFRDQVYRLAYGLLDHPAEAEEVTQDALNYALANIKRYDSSRASFSTWLHTITVSRCRNRYRRRGPINVPIFSWLESGQDVIDPALGPERRVSRDETRGQVWQAVQALKPPLREAILLRYWAGHTYHEMADILGCPLATAQSRVRLAYEQLRTRLTLADLVTLEEEQAV